jgi:hypothetical protein
MEQGERQGADAALIVPAAITNTNARFLSIAACNPRNPN